MSDTASHSSPGHQEAVEQQENGVTVHHLPYKPTRLQHISQDLIGIKLEPIVTLSSLRQTGVEVLSILTPAQQSEDFFRDRSAEQSLMLLEVQLAVLKKALVRDNIFINLPITVLTRPVIFQRLTKIQSSTLNIEIVEPAALLRLPTAQRKTVIERLLELRTQGHRVWLDDVDEVLVQPLLSCRLPLHGIKIDKDAFWRLRTTPALGQLVSGCFQLAGNVLIEGIETESDLACARQAGAGLGQGHYWPSWTWLEA